jgi:hypothetical protein
MQGCAYYKYYLKNKIFIFKNKFHPYKRKKIIDEKLFKFKCIIKKNIVIKRLSK